MPHGVVRDFFTAMLQKQRLRHRRVRRILAKGPLQQGVQRLAREAAAFGMRSAT